MSYYDDVLLMQRTISSEDNFIVGQFHQFGAYAPNITVQLNQSCEKNLSTSTVRRNLYEAGLYGRIAVKKSLLRKQNNVKRLQWVKVYKDSIIGVE